MEYFYGYLATSAVFTAVDLIYFFRHCRYEYHPRLLELDEHYRRNRRSTFVFLYSLSTIMIAGLLCPLYMPCRIYEWFAGLHIPADQMTVYIDPRDGYSHIHNA